MADGITELVGAGSAMTGAAINGALNLGSTVLTNKMNARENQKTRNWDLKMWQMQNEYNTPAAQMARFADAGLNPNLMYGQGNGGNASTVNTTSPTVYRAPSVEIPEIMPILLQAQQLMNMKTVNDKINSDINVNNQRAEGIAKDNLRKWMENSFWLQGKNDKNMFTNSNWGNKELLKIAALSSSIDLQKKLLDLRKQEGQMKDLEIGMQSNLKPFNLTPQDPAWLRGIMSLASKTGLLNRYLNSGSDSVLKHYSTAKKFNNGFIQ